MSVELGMANQYIRDLSVNTARGLRAKARRGDFPGTAPVGCLNDLLTKYAMPSPIAHEFRKMMENDRRASSHKTASLISDLEEKRLDISRKTERLTDLYVVQDIEREDYLVRRKALMLQKKSVEEQTSRLQRNAGHWLEPMQAWVKEAETLPEIAESENLHSKKSSLQKMFGSNLALSERAVSETPSIPYATLCAARENFSETDLSRMVVLGAGLEPGTPASSGRCSTN